MEAVAIDLGLKVAPVKVVVELVGGRERGAVNGLEALECIEVVVVVGLDGRQ